MKCLFVNNIYHGEIVDEDKVCYYVNRAYITANDKNKKTNCPKEGCGTCEVRELSWLEYRKFEVEYHNKQQDTIWNYIIKRRLYLAWLETVSFKVNNIPFE